MTRAAILATLAALLAALILTACGGPTGNRGAQATATYGAAQFHAQLTAIATEGK